MKTKIRYCNANELALSQDFLDRLTSSFPDIELEGISCLGYCALCARYPYVLINQQRITAEDEDELFDIIAEKLKK